MDFDVAVVGAGSAGLDSVREIAAAVYKVHLLEKHDVAVRAVEQGLVREEAEVHYCTEWTRTVGLELYRGRLLRNIFDQLTPGETQHLLRVFTVKEVRKVMAAQGGIDFPVRPLSYLFRLAVVFRAMRALPMRLWPRLAWLVVQLYRKVSSHQLGLETRPA